MYWPCSSVDQELWPGGVEQWVGFQWRRAQGRVGMFALSLYSSVSICREHKREAPLMHDKKRPERVPVLLCIMNLLMSLGRLF